ncbi:MAG: hypothetical protein ACK50A_12055 [Sphingobacteriaceae bacterium]
MKRTIKTVALMALVVSMNTACKKTYECHCDKFAGGDEHFDIKAKEDDAKVECENKAKGSTVYSKCEIE